MPIFSSRSLNRLHTCHDDLIVICEDVIDHFDFTVLEGQRTEARQNALYAQGRTKVRFPHSKHNASPSMAVDVAPYPIDWEDRERFTYLAGIMVGTAHRLRAEGVISHMLRWGGDWDGDTHLDDNAFDDLPHFELIRP